MSIIGNVGKTVGGIGKLLIPPKRVKVIKTHPKTFVQETPDEYAERLIQRRNKRY